MPVITPYDIESQRSALTETGAPRDFNDFTFKVEGVGDYEFATINELLSSNESIQQMIATLEGKLATNILVINEIETYRS